MRTIFESEMHLYLRRRSAWRPSIAASILFVSAEAVPGVVVQRVDRHRRAVARQALVEVLVREVLVAAERVRVGEARAELQRAQTERVVLRETMRRAREEKTERARGFGRAPLLLLLHFVHDVIPCRFGCYAAVYERERERERERESE